MTLGRIRLLADEPIREDNALERDGLGFNVYARVLASAALGTPGPLTIAVFGEWGTGKTSLMRMIKKQLDDQQDVVTVWFNAWQFEQEQHPLVPLIATILRGVQDGKATLQKLGDGGKGLVNTLRAVAYGCSVKASAGIPEVAQVEAVLAGKDVIDKAEDLRSDRLLEGSIYYDAYERLAKVDLGGEARIVVIIDDLDRCFPDQAIKLLESIKLVLSQPGFIFILGVSRSVIEGYVEHRYEEEYGLADFAGHCYLDKIVQLPFYIPPHRERMEDFSKSLLRRLHHSDRQELEGILSIIAAAVGANPRSTVRFINNLLIDKAINRTLAAAGTMGEISIGYFAVTRSLQQRWIQIFSLLATCDELCTTIATWDRDELSKHVESEDKDQVETATELVTDRDLRDLLFSEDGRAWLKETTFRNAAIQFLQTQRQEATQDTVGGESAVDALLFTDERNSISAVQIAASLGSKGLSSRVRKYPKPSAVPLELTHLLPSFNALLWIVGTDWEAWEVDTIAERAFPTLSRWHLFMILLPEAKESTIPDRVTSEMVVYLSEGDVREEHLAPLVTALKRLQQQEDRKARRAG